MYKINFKSISLRNFLSITKEVTFNYSEFSGLNFICGENHDVGNSDSSNGAGKSAIFLTGLLFGLFGKSEKPLNKNSYVNRTVGKDCLVRIVFEIAGDEYEVINGIKPTYMELFKNGVSITKSSINETKEYLETEILCTTFDVFRYSIALSITNTSIFEMSAAQKREFLEAVFNFNRFGIIYKNIKKDINNNSNDLLRIQSAMATREKTIEDLRAAKEKADITRQQNIDALYLKCETIEKNIDAANVKLKELVDPAEIDNEITYFIERKEKLSEARLNIQDNIRNVKTNIKNNELEIKNLTDANTRTNKVIQTYGKVYDKVGNCCKSIVSDVTDIDDAIKTIKTNEDLIQDLTNNFGVLQEQLIPLELKLSKIDEAIGVCNTEILNYKQQLQAAKLVEKTRQELVNSIANLNSQLENTLERIEELKVETDPYTDVVKTNKEELQKDSVKWNELSTHIKYLKVLEYSFSNDGIKKWITGRFVNVLNQRIIKHLEAMQANYQIIFAPDFTSRFVSSSGECEYYSFSSGERARINHAVTLAIRDMLKVRGNLSANILVCDELIDACVDDVAINALTSILRKESESTAVFLISHRQIETFVEESNKTIIVKKVNGATELEYK